MKLVMQFKKLSAKDVKTVGGKNASLGEMFKNLARKGVPVPNGFAITANAFRLTLKKNGIDGEIKKLLRYSLIGSLC
mgnify:CR=1 FL=1